MNGESEERKDRDNEHERIFVLSKNSEASLPDPEDTKFGIESVRQRTGESFMSNQSVTGDSSTRRSGNSKPIRAR